MSSSRKLTFPRFKLSSRKFYSSNVSKVLIYTLKSFIEEGEVINVRARWINKYIG